MTQTSGATVAVTMLAPSCCTTWGADNVKPHGGGGSAPASGAAAPPMNAKVSATEAIDKARIMCGS